MSARAATLLDANAGAPLRAEALEALLPLLQSNALVSAGGNAFLPNPSSIHSFGRIAKRLLAESREQASLSLGSGVTPEQITYTSCGSEANQLAIRSALEPRLSRGERVHWITTPVEHDSVLQMVTWLEQRGGEVSYLPVDESGAPCVDLLEQACKPSTALISMIWVNNETGVISDIEKAASVARARSIALHLDAAQAWGKLEVAALRTGASFLTFSAHKIGGLAGTGMLWASPRTQVVSTILGKQERGRRGGTENLLGAVALGAAAKALDPQGWSSKVRPLRDRLEATIYARIPGTIINGAAAPRVANTLNLSFEGVVGDSLLMSLDLAGFAVSSGSACSSGTLEPSHVLMALGRSKELAKSSIRVSLAGPLEWAELERFVEVLVKTVERLRQQPVRRAEQ